jgi:hypothetical protein
MTAAEIAEKQRHIRHVLYWLNTLSAQLRILEKKKGEIVYTCFSESNKREAA